jgi:hypothetical protein
LGIDKLFVSVCNGIALTNNLSFPLKGNQTMSQYVLPQFIKLWAQERLTTEQAIGQVLLHLQELAERVRLLEQRTRSVGAESGEEPQ